MSKIIASENGTDLNNKRRNIQETLSFHPVQEFPPRPVWFPGKLKKLLSSDIHEGLSKESTFSIAVNLKLLIMVSTGPQPPSQWVVVNKDFREGIFEAI